MKMNIILLFLFTFWTLTTQAYFSFVNTGDVLPDKTYRLTGEGQLIPEGGGVNLVGHFDTSLSGDSELRLTMGTGSKTDFQLGLGLKWVPFPDFENQPAMGIVLGVLYGRFETISQNSLRITPFVSKKYKENSGVLEVYTALPMGLTFVKNDQYTPLQIAFGGNARTPDIEKFTFGAEIGFNLEQAFSYVSAFLTLEFDEKDGIQFR